MLFADSTENSPSEDKHYAFTLCGRETETMERFQIKSHE